MTMEKAEQELERRSKFLNSLILKKKSVEEKQQNEHLNVRVRASDMPFTLQNHAFKCARDNLDAMACGKLDSKRLALALKKEFDSTYGPAWHCVVGTSFGSYVTHSIGGFLYFSIDKVCKSFRDALKDDILPWLNIMVEKPLNTRFSDDFLVKITSNTKGRLRVVALKNCFKITDEGLLQVIASNPLINKIYLQGCTGLTIEGVIEAVKLHAKANHRLKNLAISGIYNVKTEDFEILCHLMGINQIQMKQGKKNYYHTRRELSAFKRESQPSIDVDICPKCGEIREVFDCPRDSCKRRMQQQQQQQQQKQVLMECCRGCFLCVPRCEECGICTKDEELGEAACADILCLNCWLKLPKCSFCNKAYCNQHAYNQQSLYPGGFLCSHCSFHATQSSHY